MRTNGNLGRWTLAVGLLLAGVFAALGAASQNIALYRDLGTLTVKTNVVASFLWKNTGSNAIQVLRVTPTCECLDIIARPETIAPGQDATFTVRLHTSTVGVMDYGMTVSFANDPVEKLFVLSANVTDTQKRPPLDVRLLLPVRELLETNPVGRTIIDVREPDKFQQAHIPGSLNIPLYQIKTKAYLKKRNLVLVNEGHEEESLLEECNRLLDRQFASVRVLEGGLRLLQQKAGELEGSNPKSIMTAMLTPEEFDSGRYEPGWHVVYLAGKNETTGSAQFFNGKTVSLDQADEDLRLALLNVAIDQAAVKRMLLVTSQGEGDERLLNLAGKLPLPPVFFLEGGEEGYQERLRWQMAASNRRLVTQVGQSSTRFARYGGSYSRKGGCGCGK